MQASNAIRSRKLLCRRWGPRASRTRRCSSAPYHVAVGRSSDRRAASTALSSSSSRTTRRNPRGIVSWPPSDCGLDTSTVPSRLVSSLHGTAGQGPGLHQVVQAVAGVLLLGLVEEPQIAFQALRRLEAAVHRVAGDHRVVGQVHRVRRLQFMQFAGRLRLAGPTVPEPPAPWRSTAVALPSGPARPPVRREGPAG